jgi:autotransporter-associated beta strand protein
MNSFIPAAIRCSLMFLVPALVYADSAQWNLNPISGDWNTAANWTPMTVPNGPTDIATFDLSNIAGVSISANTEVNAIAFTPAATNPYTITASPGLTLTIGGVGITNNTGSTQNFVTAVDGTGSRGQIIFTNSAAVGGSTTFTNNGASVNGNLPAGTWFLATSSAGNGTFVNEGGAVSGNSLFQGGFTAFVDSSTAGDGSFTNDGGIGGVGGQILFFNTSNGGNGTFINNAGNETGAGGYTEFFDSSSAGNGTFMNQTGTGFFGYTRFSGISTAGNGVFVNDGATITNLINGGQTSFNDASTAGEATITNNGSLASNAGFGKTLFFYNSIADSATIVNDGGTVSGAYGGLTEFFAFAGNPAAGSATIINKGAAVSGAYGGLTDFSSFDGTPTAGSAILVANGGLNGGGGGMISFEGNSTGGTSRIEVFGNGNLDISGHDSPGVTIGSIEGDGNAFLGTNNLTVGSNNLSTTFSGAIQDGGFGGSLTKIGTRMLILTAANAYAGLSNINRGVLQIDGPVLRDTFAIQGGGVGGSLTKIGPRTLILSGANTYTGDTNVDGGVLQVDGSISSNTFVNPSGTLAGSGNVNGNVANNNGGNVTPGGAPGVPGVLTVADNYIQTRAARLVIHIGGAGAGQVSVLNILGDANLNGALDPELVNGFVPEVGQSFQFMNYASFTGSFSHIVNHVFDRGRKRWRLVYGPNTASLVVVRNGRQ